jgi:ABC-type branched-subunit amino acid transport system substrate-binding protein
MIDGTVGAGRGSNPRRVKSRLVALVLASVVLMTSSPHAQAPSGGAVEIAVSLPLTGDGSTTFGRGTLNGIQFAIDEANAAGAGPQIKLTVYDDQASENAVTEVAEKIIASPAMLVIGPSYSTASLAQGPFYAKAGLASLCPTATSDAITENATTFRMIFKNSQQAEAIATYLARVLGGKRADVIVVDNKYGQTLRMGFEDAAKRLGIDARWFVFQTADETEAIAQRLAADKSDRAIVFLTLDGDAARILTKLRREGLRGPFLGDDALGDESFSSLFADLPEERAQPGFFTEGLYGVSPMMLDSANAETLVFADRFRARFGHDPDWMSVAGYDAGRMAVAAVQAAVSSPGANPDSKALRAGALNWLASLNSLERALPGLIGPLWFDAEHGGHKAVRIGRFYRGRFESAPLQIIAVSNPDPAEVTSGAVFELEPGSFARMQRVVYSGMFLNEIARVDIAQSTFTADLYVWMRFARVANAADADPTEIEFPSLVRGSFEAGRPAATGDLDDGTVYRLWKVRGDFKNDFDLRHYPSDRQSLAIQFFNARAASDRLVYVQDRRSSENARDLILSTAATLNSSPMSALAGQPMQTATATPPTGALGNAATPDAFRNLTQWEPVRASERRDSLVTASALGDPRLVGVERVRELSGFGLNVELKRRVLATLAKTSLPLALMSLIMYASLYFPAALVKEKVTVAITGALSGAVLLSSINSQLGNVGYVLAIEYGFYIFFVLCLLCIVAVLVAERFRSAGRQPMAAAVERSGRYLFAVGLVGTAGAGWLLASQW